MIYLRAREALHSTVMFAILAMVMAKSFADSGKSQVIDRELRSENISHNQIGTDPIRKMAVYLPAGYDTSSTRYPVIYFLPTPFENYRAPFDRRNSQALFDGAISSGVIGGFILVAVDMTTPVGCSWYVNSPVTGRWEDFMVKELVPYIDANFRTLPSRDSRGIAGDFMGGYGAIRFGMKHPDVFGSVYALHPVGTGSGVQMMYSRTNWDVLANAKSLDALKADGTAQIFMGIFQAALPDPERPPMFVDLPARKDANTLVIDAQLTKRLRENFFLESMIPEFADNLRSLRGFKFDWTRSDPNEDHVYANQVFTRKLNEFGVVHQAEEYNGAWGSGNWGPEGRIAMEMLPFFQEHLVFEGRR